MKNKHKILGIILGIQILLIGLVNITGNSSNAKAGESLLDIANKSDINQILIEEAGEKLSLTLDKKGWILPESNNLPVSKTKIENVLDSLLSLKKTWPVATTSSAANRFEVNEDNAKKKLILKKGDDEIASLYLGTSPGFKKTHLRVNDSDDIYAAAINNFDLSSKSIDWMDKFLLKTEKADLFNIKFNGLSLVKKGNEWALEDQTDEEIINEEELEKIINFIGNLQVTSILEKEKVKDFVMLKPVVEISTIAAQKDINYQIYSFEDKTAIKSNLRDEWFQIAKYTVDKIKDLKRENLVKEKPAEEPAESGVLLPTG